MRPLIAQLHQLALFFFRLRNLSERYSAHGKNVKNGLFSTHLALCLYMPAGILEYPDGFGVAVRALDKSRFLFRNLIAGAPDFLHHLRRKRLKCPLHRYDHSFPLR